MKENKIDDEPPEDIDLPEIMKGLEGDETYQVRDELFDKGWVKQRILGKEEKKRALNIRPFTRLIWKSEQEKEEWSRKISEASIAYHDTEWEMTARGKRKCGTIHVDSNNYDRRFREFTEDDLFFYPISKSAKYEGFSHQHIEPKEGEDYYVYGAYGKDPEDVISFEQYENEEGDHESIGDLLGFPRCCQKAFTERWPESIDPLFEAAQEAGETKEILDGRKVVLDSIPPEPHQLLRYFGVRITSHLPCSLKCEKTEEKGKEWFDVMKDINSEGAEYAKEILELPLRWDAYRGIVEVETPHFIGITTTGFFKKRRVVEINGW